MTFLWWLLNLGDGGAAGSGGRDHSYTYVAPYQLRRQEDKSREILKKHKTDLDRVNSVIAENERKKNLATESKLQAEQRKKVTRAIELAELESEYLNEIARLIIVRDGIVRRIKKEEELLTIMIVAKKHRLRSAI